jgi:hypothetical protein
MGEWAPAVAVVGLALIIGATLVLSGPVGKALGEWIRGWSKHEDQWMAVQAAKHGAAPAPWWAATLSGEPEPWVGEMEELKRRLAEVEDRLDFAERLLAREREASRLEPPR